jgi:PKD repeat protein/uncharacterized protein YgiM (DUF1202 family)
MIRRFFDDFSKYSASTKVALVAVVAIWTAIAATLVVGAVLLLERTGQAQQSTPGGLTPTITLEPTSGPPGTVITVRSDSWEPGQVVLIYLLPPGQTELPNFASAGSTADDTGRFNATVVIPSGPEWQSPGAATLVARVAGDGASAQAPFQVTEAIGQPVPSPTLTELPTLTPTATPTPMPAPEPGVPTATAKTDLNIRGGPGTLYPVLGLLRAGQSAQVTGISSDGGWWQIIFTGAADERGWIAAAYTAAENTGNVPVVGAPSPPASPTPTPTPQPSPTPVVIHNWRGEYYSNLGLSGSPAMVRDDGSISFNWGGGSPAPGLPVDNFSVRWTRNVEFATGSYRFSMRVDDGGRLWIDGNLVIDQWHDSSASVYTADVGLSAGVHNLRMEYYEHAGDALAQLTWQPVPAQTYPDWKGEYYSNRDLSGNPALVRNDGDIDFDWGVGSPASGLPVDNFSVRWTRVLDFSAGTYRFSARVDDGVRLWIDDKRVIDEWHDSAPTTYHTDVTLSQGSHTLRMEYYEHNLGALAQLDWERTSDYPDWKAEYFDNRKLEGDPLVVRNETEIDHDWGSGSPAAGLPADNFSARWTRKVDLEEGTYLLTVRVDDGVRMWIDDQLVIDSWKDGSARTLQTQAHVNDGKRRIKVEYYERSGKALIEVQWERKEQPANQPPQASAGGPYQVDEGGLIRLNGAASRDPDGTIAKYEWDFNYDGQAFTVDATGSTADTRYPDGPANVTIALRVTDDKGATGLDTTQVQVRNAPPTANAGGPYSGQAGSPISMAGAAVDPSSADQAGLTYVWDFGDGGQANGSSVSHTYAQPGLYPLSLTVTDKDGGQGQATSQVQVSALNQAPTAAFSGPAMGLVGQQLSFDASGSNDPDGAIATYDWDFGDGASAQGVQATHAYTTAGNYTVKLTVTDDGDLTDSVTHDVAIQAPAPSNQAPTAAFSGPATGLVGEQLSFDASGSNDPDGSIAAYAWDFGDGASAQGVQATHVYTAAGSYTVRLTVTDDGDLTDSVTHGVTVQAPPNQAPTAAFSGPATGLVGEQLSFDASGSSDPDGNIATYAWDFGDGASAQGVQATHTYAAAGSYTVRLTVTDDGGLTDSVTHGVTVQAPPNQAPTAAFSGPATGLVGEQLSFDASGSSDPEGPIALYGWNFGDGASAQGVQATHAYTAAGNYTVRLTVTDDGGLTDTATQAVVVEPATAAAGRSLQITPRNQNSISATSLTGFLFPARKPRNGAGR